MIKINKLQWDALKHCMYSKKDCYKNECKGIYVDNDNQCLVSTNGNALCRLKMDFELDSFLFSADFTLKKNEHAIYDSQTSETVTFRIVTYDYTREIETIQRSETCKLIDLDFPDYNRIMVDTEKAIYNTTFNPYLLPKGMTYNYHFPEIATSPIAVTPINNKNGLDFVFMPYNSSKGLSNEFIDVHKENIKLREAIELLKSEIKQLQES